MMLPRRHRSFVGTVPTSFFYGLQESLRLIEEEGLDAVLARHARLAGAVRAAVQRWSGNDGPQLFCLDPARYSDSVTAVLMPEGVYGPAFLTPKNYYVLKEYNFSDLYVLFVGHLSDLIGGGGPFVTPWSKTTQLRTHDVEEMQQRLTALGFYKDKLDGKAGMLTRAALGAFQKSRGLKTDCWPSADVLGKMR